ncbi:MAG: hypothetical protein WDN28_00095 [Chthoniobacter sp.]
MQRLQPGIFRGQTGHEFCKVIDRRRALRDERAEDRSQDGEQQDGFHGAGVVTGLVVGAFSPLAAFRRGEDE